MTKMQIIYLLETYVLRNGSSNKLLQQWDSCEPSEYFSCVNRSWFTVVEFFLFLFLYLQYHVAKLCIHCWMISIFINFTELHWWSSSSLLVGSKATGRIVPESTERKDYNSPQSVEEIYSFPKCGTPKLYQIPQKSASTGEK